MNVTIHWPQVVILAWFLIVLIVMGINHGKPRDGEYNVIATFAVWAFFLFVMAKGGFFG